MNKCIQCPQCNAVINADAVFCPECGTKNNAYNEEITRRQVSSEKNKAEENPSEFRQPEAAKSIDKMCFVGFILSIVLSFVGLSIISLSVCIVGIIDFDETRNTGKGFGIAGIIISSASIFICLLLIGVFMLAFSQG